jgi:hypothetical protein
VLTIFTAASVALVGATAALGANAITPPTLEQAALAAAQSDRTLLVWVVGVALTVLPGALAFMFWINIGMSKLLAKLVQRNEDILERIVEKIGTCPAANAIALEMARKSRAEKIEGL